MVVTVDGDDHRLTAAEAVALRTALGDALAREEAFFRTACERRPDGSYVVRRRTADSAGHSKVFESVAAVRSFFDDLPSEFTAEDVGGSTVTGGRRHLLVHHFAEHPDFPCELVRRQPLTARKTEVTTAD